MAGYSFAGQVGHRGQDRIWARCLLLADAETHDPVAWVFLDLMSASLALHRAVGLELIRRGREDLSTRFVLTGTHCHSAPGKFYGNSFYDRFASPLPSKGFDSTLTSGWATLITQSILEAEASREPAELSVVERKLFGVSYNRSYEAWLRNKLPLRGSERLEPEQRAINPVLTAIVALKDGKHLASAAFYACHGTTLGPHQETYDRDWFGVATDLVEHMHGGTVALGGGTSGDISPRVRLSKGRYFKQGERLKRRVGIGVARTLDACIREAMADGSPLAPLPITLHSGMFEITERDQWPRFQVGVPMLAGSEDGGSDFVKLRWVSEMINEGFLGDGGAQAPKAPAFGPMQGTLLSALQLDISAAHPWHRVRLGDHLFCSLPGEPTGPAGAFIEAELCARLEVKSATTFGYTGDYAGYFTTPEEYAAQHYEGGSTLYGPASLECFAEQVTGPDRAVPLHSPVDEVLPPARSDVPRRDLHLLLEQGLEHPEGRSDRRVVFAVPKLEPGDALPQVTVAASGQRKKAAVRRFPHPDRRGAAELSTLIAVVSGLPSQPEWLEVDGQAARPIVGAEKAKWRFSAQGGSVVKFPPRRTQPWFILSSAVNLLAFAIGLVAPGFVLHLLNQQGGGMREFAVRMVALTPGLLAVEHYGARATPDAVAALGHARAGLLFWASLFLTSLLLWLSPPVLGLSFVGLALSAVLHDRIQVVRGRHNNPARERWEFWPPLYFVSWLTLGVGLLFISCAQWIVPLLAGQSDTVAAWFVRLFGVGFLCNTLAMKPSSMSRDLRVIRGQLRGSLLFDLLAPTLFVLSIATGDLQMWTLALAGLFVVIDLWFWSLLGRAQNRMETHIERPNGVLEVARHIRETASQLGLVRFLGSNHSVGPSIFVQGPPGPPLRRRSQSPGSHVSLERLDRIVAIDRERRRLTVEAGIHLGLSPNQPRSADNHLLGHLRLHGWALPNLGGIVHQSLGGFLATGSSGGSLKFSFADAVEEIRFVDGTGAVQIARRGEDLMDALLVSMGLLGPVIEVTLQCDERYMVTGREVSGPISDDGVLKIPNREDEGDRDIPLKEAGALVGLLAESDYHRILWWPQEGVQKMVLWEASRAETCETELIDYPIPPWPMQFFAGALLSVMGWSFGKGLPRALGRLSLKGLPWAVNQFIVEEPVRFYEGWDRILPMDTRVDDYLLPTEFTEMWFPVDRTHEVMAALLELYRDPRAAGTFSCELYTATASPAWLSPAHGRDVFRVDVFWFKHNRGDPVLDYFPQFWELLEKYSFRCHWGKYLPQPGSKQGAAYIAREYTMLPRFKRIRRSLDPKDIFVTSYYQRQLALQLGDPSQPSGSE